MPNSKKKYNDGFFLRFSEKTLSKLDVISMCTNISKSKLAKLFVEKQLEDLQFGQRSLEICANKDPFEEKGPLQADCLKNGIL